MKQTLIFPLTFVLLFAFGCSQKSEAEKSQPTKQNATQTSSKDDLQKNDAEKDNEKSSPKNFFGDMLDLGMSAMEKASQAESPADLADVAADTFDSAAQSVLQTTDDMFPATLDDEIEFGKILHDEIVKDSNAKEIDANDTRLYPIWKKLRPKRNDVAYRLFVIDKDIVNAFAHAGGYVYIYTGLIEKSSDDILAFVLAHEISHIDLKHVNAGLGRLKAMKNIPGSEMINAAAEKLSPSYSQEKEFEADAAGWQLAISAGYRPKEMIKFFDISASNAESQPPKKTESDDIASQIAHQAERIMYRLDHHFATHPPTSERRKRLEK